MKFLGKATSIALISAMLIFLLLGFVSINYDYLRSISNQEKMISLGCGTTAFEREQRPVLSTSAEKGQEVFYSNCKSCHRLDQQLVGPPLRGIFNRRDSLWIRQMIVNADKLIRSGNKAAVKLFKEYNETQHTNFEGLPKQEVDKLMEYLKAEPTK